MSTALTPSTIAWCVLVTMAAATSGVPVHRQRPSTRYISHSGRLRSSGRLCSRARRARAAGRRCPAWAAGAADVVGDVEVDVVDPDRVGDAAGHPLDLLAVARHQRDALADQLDQAVVVEALLRLRPGWPRRPRAWPWSASPGRGTRRRARSAGQARPTSTVHAATSNEVAGRTSLPVLQRSASGRRGGRPPCLPRWLPSRSG